MRVVVGVLFLFLLGFRYFSRLPELDAVLAEEEGADGTTASTAGKRIRSKRPKPEPLDSPNGEEAESAKRGKPAAAAS